MKHLLPLIIVILLSAFPVHATTNISHIEDLLTAKGIERNLVEQLMSDPRVSLDPQIVIKNLFFSSPKAEVKKTQTMFVAPNYVIKGRRFIKTNKKTFKHLEREYGVPAEIITAILIIETKLGGYKPKYDVFHAYISLAACLDDAYLQNIIDQQSSKYPRLLEENAKVRAQKKGRWALNQLAALIKISTDLQIDPLEIRGSFSGAMGPGQFIPTSFMTYGVDGNLDGSRNPFEMEDAMASIANYIKLAGWSKSASLEKKRKSIWRYNHSEVYVNTIMNLSQKLK